MLFNSLTFIVFFAVVLIVYRLPLPWKWRKTHLLVASYLFYAAWNPPFVLLVWLSTVVDWVIARRLAAAKAPGGRRALVVASLGVNLGLLGVFKYGQFILENFVVLMNQMGFDYAPAVPSIILPVGISFYTFQTLSYTIDVYRRELEPSDSFLDFALFVTFFPQLVAGPIVRASYFLPQCRKPIWPTRDQLGWGLTLLIAGLAEKVVLADGLMAPVSDIVFAQPHDAGRVDVIVGALAFTAQLFFDFSGYSLCAIGAALCLGFVVPHNFRFPYASIGFSEFWRRWHISLSSWLRDYLYIPLGGSRNGTHRAVLNLFVVMVLGGLWHGAGWGFVWWGALHGVYLAGERVLRAWGAGARLGQVMLGRALLVSLTFGLWCFSLIPFRAADLDAAWSLVSILFFDGPNLLELGQLAVVTVGVTVVVLVLSHRWLKDSSMEGIFLRLPWWLRSAVLTALMVLLFLAPRSDRAFLYFQF